MVFLTGRCALILPVALVISAGPAHATEGYFQHGYGIVSKSLAGAGAAYSQDAMAQALNPAGLVNVGNQVNVGVSLFSPRREITGSGTGGGFNVPTGTVDSDREYFVIPNIGVSYQIDDVSAVGVALYGNGGMNTDYPDVARSDCPGGGSGVFCGGSAGVDLTQGFLQATYAREVAEGVSIGGGPILAFQSFEARGLSALGASGFSSDPAHLTDNGHDQSYGIGGRIGVQAALSPTVRVGAAYQIRTYMTEFDDYRGLFAEQGDFDIPPALQIGLSWQPVDDVTLLLDYRRIWYSDVNSVGNPFAAPAGSLLGNDSGSGFGWRDIDIFKVGAQWEVDDTWTVRAGYSYSENPITSSEVLFNVLAPGVIEHHITGGVSYRFSDGGTAFLGAGFFAPSSDISGPNPLSPGQNIELEMHQYEVSFGAAWQF